MKIFDYVRPTNIPEAIAAASEPGSVYLAAGTNLLDLMKDGIVRPDRLVDITHLPGLEHMPDGSLRIGALVRNADLLMIRLSPTYPAIAEALLSGPLRNCATPRPLAAICCSGPAAHIFTILPAPATNAGQAPAAMPAMAPTGCMRCSAGAKPVSPPTLPISACLWWRWMPSRKSKARPAGAKCGSRICTACPETHRHWRPCSSPATSIVAIRLPAGATAFSAHARYLKVRERTSYAFAVVSSPRRSISNPAISDRPGSPSAGSLPGPGAPCSRSDTHRRAGG